MNWVLGRCEFHVKSCHVSCVQFDIKMLVVYDILDVTSNMWLIKSNMWPCGCAM